LPEPDCKKYRIKGIKIHKAKQEEVNNINMNK
jgi:hypothetical protein